MAEYAFIEKLELTRRQIERLYLTEWNARRAIEASESAAAA